MISNKIKRVFSAFMAIAFVFAFVVSFNENEAYVAYAASSVDSMISLNLCGQVNATNVNVRKGSSTDEKSFTKLNKKTPIKINGIVKDWYKIQYGNVSGYIKAKYVDVKVVTTAAVNLRNKPSTDSKKLSTISKSKVFLVKGYYKTSGKNWYKITYKSKTGYICGDYAKSYFTVKDSAESIKSTTTSSKATQTQKTTKKTTKATTTDDNSTSGNSVKFYDKTTKIVKVSADTVTMRKKASTNSKKVVTLKKDTVLTIISDGSNGKWWHATATVDGKKYTGYVYKNYTHETWHLTKSDYTLLCKIVMAEAGNEPNKGIILLAQAMLDRASFYNSFDKACKQVCSNNRYAVTKEVKEAVNTALNGKRITTERAIYWYAFKTCKSKWHESLHFVAQVGGHRFFNDF